MSDKQNVGVLELRVSLNDAGKQTARALLWAAHNEANADRAKYGAPALPWVEPAFDAISWRQPLEYAAVRADGRPGKSLTLVQKVTHGPDGRPDSPFVLGAFKTSPFIMPARSLSRKPDAQYSPPPMVAAPALPSMPVAPAGPAPAAPDLSALLANPQIAAQLAALLTGGAR